MKEIRIRLEKSWHIFMGMWILSFVIAAAYGAFFQNIYGEIYYLAAGICGFMATLFFVRFEK